MKLQFLKSSVFAAAAVMTFNGVAVAAQPSAPAQCLSKDEVVAEKIRRLKTTLMVGALQCDRASHLRVAESYNAFVETHGATIQAHDQTLTRYFQRAHGSSYRKMMDRHVTSMANKVATQSYKTTNFCEAVAALASASLTNSPETLLAVADQNMIATAKLAPCAVPLTRAAQSGSSVTN